MRRVSRTLRWRRDPRATAPGSRTTRSPTSTPGSPRCATPSWPATSSPRSHRRSARTSSTSVPGTGVAAQAAAAAVGADGTDRGRRPVSRAPPPGRHPASATAWRPRRPASRSPTDRSTPSWPTSWSAISPTTRVALADLARVLRAGGRLGITTWGRLDRDPDIDDADERAAYDDLGRGRRRTRRPRQGRRRRDRGASVGGLRSPTTTFLRAAALADANLSVVDAIGRAYRYPLSHADWLGRVHTSARGRYAHAVLGDDGVAALSPKRARRPARRRHPRPDPLRRRDRDHRRPSWEEPDHDRDRSDLVADAHRPARPARPRARAGVVGGEHPRLARRRRPPRRRRPRRDARSSPTATRSPRCASATRATAPTATPPRPRGLRRRHGPAPGPGRPAPRAGGPRDRRRRPLHRVPRRPRRHPGRRQRAARDPAQRATTPTNGAPRGRPASRSAPRSPTTSASSRACATTPPARSATATTSRSRSPPARSTKPACSPRSTKSTSSPRRRSPHGRPSSTSGSRPDSASTATTSRRGTSTTRSSRTRRIEGAVDLDPYFADADLEALTRRTFAGLGLDIDPVLARQRPLRTRRQEPARVLHPHRPRGRRAGALQRRAERALGRHDAPRVRPRGLRPRARSRRFRGSSASRRTRSPPRASR